MIRARAPCLALRSWTGGTAINWLVGGSEIVLGVALLVGLVFVVLVLRPPRGALQEIRIISFPGAWIIVGLPLTFAIGASVALIAVGIGILR